MPMCRQCGNEFEPTAAQRRYCSATCRRRRWDLANPLKKRASEWVWQCQNRSRIAAVHRAWYLANRERALETSRLWTHLNRERKAAYQRERAERISTWKWRAEDLAQASAPTAARGKISRSTTSCLSHGVMLALEALIDGRRRRLGECRSPYRVRRLCRDPRQSNVASSDTDVAPCDVRWMQAA